MANPTTLVGEMLAILKATTDEQVVALDPDRAYTLLHTGLREDGTTADEDPIFLAVDAAAVVESFAAGANKYPLMSGYSVVIGPGARSLRFETGTGTPVFAVSATEKQFGNY